MSRAYVLVTAMPPTKGHLHLIQFASHVADSTEVVLATQPDEPYPYGRLQALRDATKDIPGVHLHHIHKPLPQEPEGGGEEFWDMWAGFLTMFGLQPDDYIVASEMYGVDLARVTGATFIPYDIDRDIYRSQARFVRMNPLDQFDRILPEFQPNLIQRVTIFGAESTGKTTLSKLLAEEMDGHWLPEWARPYMEKVRNEINHEIMTNIWTGQKALQLHGHELRDKPFVFQDTDLFSTVGYWDLHGADILDPETGKETTTPGRLALDALVDQSDLYLIPQSNIPFEPDPLRYGGDHREGSDEFWIGVCEEYELNYKVLQSSSPLERFWEARDLIDAHYKNAVKLDYVRVTDKIAK